MIVEINQKLCTACGVCGQVCPRYILETVKIDGKKTTQVSAQRIDLCMTCGHCAAACPNQAIQVAGLNTEDYQPIHPLSIDESQLQTLFRQRRSIRRYKNKPVPRPVIDQMIGAAQSAPTGTGRATTGVIVMDNPDTLAAFSELAYQLYEKLEAGLKNPIARIFIGRSAGKKQLRTLQEFLMPGMHWYIRWYREGKSNEILRDCPALLLFHSPVNEPVAAENCLVAAFHAVLMAEVLGIGTCFNDIIPPACNRVPEIRELLGLPADREVYASLTLGYPKYTYHTAPPHKLAEVRYLE